MKEKSSNLAKKHVERTIDMWKKCLFSDDYLIKQLVFCEKI